MGAGWHIGRVAGIELRVHPSWLVIAFLIVYSLAVAQLPRQSPGWSTGQYWIVAAATGALFFASVLVHELSHALVARRFGLRVSSIQLFIFGGATTLETDSRGPREEAVIAVAGPLSSLVLGVGFLALDLVIDQVQLATLVAWLGVVNIALGIFNLIPGFPMDGGRVLRAVLWRLRGDRLVATRNAATVGRILAYLMIGAGVLIAFQPGGVFSGLWLVLIGWFLSSAAEATSSEARIESRLQGITVRDAMDESPPVVSPNETIAELVQDRILRGEVRSYLVEHPDGGLAGIVTLTDVGRVAQADWPTARVTDVMTRFADLVTIRPDAPLVDALRSLEEKSVGQLPVIEQDARKPVGMVTRRGILRLLEARLKLGV